jgi:hypothetical protein
MLAWGSDQDIAALTNVKALVELCKQYSDIYCCGKYTEPRSVDGCKRYSRGPPINTIASDRNCAEVVMLL